MQTKVLSTEWYFQGGIPYSLNLHAVIFEKDVTANCKKTEDKIVDFDDLVDTSLLWMKKKWCLCEILVEVHVEEKCDEKD